VRDERCDLNRARRGAICIFPSTLSRPACGGCERRLAGTPAGPPNEQPREQRPRLPVVLTVVLPERREELGLLSRHDDEAKADQRGQRRQEYEPVRRHKRNADKKRDPRRIQWMPAPSDMDLL
jgi:hypothetical protein